MIVFNSIYRIRNEEEKLKTHIRGCRRENLILNSYLSSMQVCALFNQTRDINCSRVILARLKN